MSKLPHVIFWILRPHFIKGMNTFDHAYSLLVTQVLGGSLTQNRTGVDTFSVFGTRLEVSLIDSFPLLTTKRMFWKGIVEELLWFIRGGTNSKELESKGINIWKGNSSQDFLAKQGLGYQEGELGPIYGYQWRNWGGDQLQKVIDQLRDDPTSRRIILSSWNVEDIPKMALPPCHILAQFNVCNGLLNCQVYQRSIDMFHGLPFNVPSYALLTHILANITGYTPGKLVFVGGDTHIYSTHISFLKDQISRVPFDPPQLVINRKLESINDLSFDDFELVGYQHHGPLKADMVV